MGKYHINPKSGQVSRCTAQSGNCPFGSEELHYASAAKALAAYEKSQGGSFMEKLHNRGDVYSQAALDGFKRLQETMNSPVATKVFHELESLIKDGRPSDLHRLGQAAAAKAEIANEFDHDEEAQVYFNIYKIMDAASTARFMSRKNQEKLDWYAQRREDQKTLMIKERLLGEIRNYEDTMRFNIEAIAQKPLPFDFWSVVDSDGFGRSYRLKEVPSTHPKLREILAESDEAILGRISSEEKAAALEELNTNAQALLLLLEDRHGGYIPSAWDNSARLGPLDDSGTFELLGGGVEVNVYLHRESMMVYKVRHGQNFGKEKGYGRAAVIRLQEQYENSNLKALAELNASYLKTYFLEVQTSAGEGALVVSQPYLDHKEYGPYDPSEEEGEYFLQLGLKDVHPGNLSMELKTGRLVLFDCIYSGD